MVYGLSVVNNYGAVVISSEYKVMVFSERGTFRIISQYTDTEGYGAVAFIRPVLTQEPPQVFVRHVSGVHPSLGIYTTMLGGPGNWTGFRVTSAVRGNPNLQNYSMEYVSCKYADQPSPQLYGMEIRDSSGKIVFTSSDRVVRYSKFAKNWRRVQGNYVDAYHSDLPIDADDFICISAFDRGVSWFTNYAKYAGLTILEGGIQVLKMNCQFQQGDWYYQGVNGSCFGIPVCKFPSSRYYN
jgi:hypothetical protein